MRNRMGRGKSDITMFALLMTVVMSVTGCGIVFDKTKLLEDDSEIEVAEEVAVEDVTTEEVAEEEPAEESSAEEVSSQDASEEVAANDVSYPLQAHGRAIIDYKGKMYNDAGKVVDMPDDLGMTYYAYYDKDWSGAIIYSDRGPCYYVDRELNFKFLCNKNTCASISFNGAAVVYGQSGEGDEKGLFWYDTEKDESVKIMSADSGIVSAALSPNGKKVAFVQYGGDNSKVFVAERDSRPEPVANGHYDVLSVSDAGDVICTEYFGKVYSFSKGKKKTIADDWHMGQYCLNNKCTEIMYTGRGERGDENVYYYAFGMDGPEMIYEGGVGTLIPGGYYVRQSNGKSSLHHNIYDTETLLGTRFYGPEMTPYMFHGVGREVEQFPARSHVLTINSGEDYTVMVQQRSAENKSITIKKYRNGECLDEKVLDDITGTNTACDERGQCFYIVDDFGILYRYEDDELKEIDKNAKADMSEEIKVNHLDGLLYYRKGADLYVVGDETEPTAVVRLCDGLTSGFGNEFIIFYQDASYETHALIFGNDVEGF